MSLAAERRRKAKAIEEAGAALSVKLVARSTRGQRISELQGEDAEADETFWGQGAWQEAEEGDSEFSSEEEEPDKFDKDFNDSESEEEDDDGKEENRLRKNERAAKRKKPAGGVYKEPKGFVAKKRKAAASPRGSGADAEEKTSGKAQDARGSGGAKVHMLTKRTMRASTKNKTEKSLEVREGEAKAREAQLKRSTPQLKKALRSNFTQKQLLLEAIQTEQENMRWILKQQRLEDEAKEDEGRPKQHKILASRYVSRRGHVDTIFFPDANQLPPVLCQVPSSGTAESEESAEGQRGNRSTRRCKITGAPALYTDPLTGYPYANAAAFRQIRKRYGAAARRRLKAQQEGEVGEAADGGVATGAGGGIASGNKADGDAAAAATATAGGGGGVSGSTGGTGGAVGNGPSKGAGAGAAASGGGQSSGGGGKKHGSTSSSSKEGEKKSKSSASKGKGKGKGSGGGAGSKAAEGSAGSKAAEGGTTVTATSPPAATDTEKAKSGTKRKQAAGTKGTKPVKRPFFASGSGTVGTGAAARIASAPPPAGGKDGQGELVPLKRPPTAVIHYGTSEAVGSANPAPEGSAVVRAAAYAAVSAQQASTAGWQSTTVGRKGASHGIPEGSAVVKAAAYAAAAAQRAAASIASAGTVATVVTAGSGAALPKKLHKSATAGTVPAERRYASTTGIAATTACGEGVVQPTLSQQHQQATTGITGWETGPSKPAAGGGTKITKWVQSAPSATPLGQPPG